MNVLDLIIGIILILFAISGLRKGLIIEAFYLASFIVGIYGAMFFSDIVADWMSGFVDVNTEILAVIAFIVTFILFVVLIRFLGHIISKLVEAIHLGIFDKIGGFLFGVMKGIKEAGATVYIVIENGSWENVYSGKYRSQMHPNALIANLTAWMARYNAHIVFCRAETFPKLAKEILYREAKEYLQDMEVNANGD